MTSTVPDFLDVGDGPAILFLHGLGGDKNNWQPQLDAFADGYRCLAWTMPGYGSSPAIAELTWPNLAAAAVRVLDDAGIESASVVGLSMGGYVAQQLAADQPARVNSLVLAATTSQFGRGSASFAERFLASRLQPIDEGAAPADFAATVVAALLSDHATAETTASAIASMSQISADAYRAALTCLVTWNFIDRLNEIAAPSLCLAGADDKTAPVEAVQALADGLPNADFAVIDNCRHLLNLDQPAAFNRALAGFLADHPT